MLYDFAKSGIYVVRGKEVGLGFGGCVLHVEQIVLYPEWLWNGASKEGLPDAFMDFDLVSPGDVCLSNS